jgi:hypothetical protein
MEPSAAAKRRMELAEIEKRRIREAAEEARRNPAADPFALVRAQARERAEREIAERADEADVRRVREMAERIKAKRSGERLDDMLDGELDREIAFLSGKGDSPRLAVLRAERERRRSEKLQHFGIWA